MQGQRRTCGSSDLLAGSSVVRQDGASLNQIVNTDTNGSPYTFSHQMLPIGYVVKIGCWASFVK